MNAQTIESQAVMTPQMALEILENGNKLFVENLRANRNLISQVRQTSEGQYPFATVLHCIDSRVSSELVFDQGVGDVFSIRIAGNFINKDILGSMEFATKLAGAKLIVVMGHTHCGAVKGACDHVEMGNLTSMLSNLMPVVEQVEKNHEVKGSKNADLVQEVADENVIHALSEIKLQSPIIAEMLAKGEVGLVGAMYDVESGKVTFSELQA